MSPTTPAPPNAVVSRGTVRQRRFAAPHPSNLFIVAPSLRGNLHQGRGLAALTESAGERQNWSALHDDGLAALAESNGSTFTFARVYGPAAIRASVTITNAGTPACKITAKEVGPWANGATGGLMAAIEEFPASSGKRRVRVTQGATTVAISPATAVHEELVAWSDANDVVEYQALGTALPIVTAATSLAGGTDDRANIGTADWVAAANRCEDRFGPGIAFAPGATDVATRTALRTAFAARNRVLFDGDARGTTPTQSLANLATIRSSTPDSVAIGGTFLGHAWTRPLTTEPERLTSSAALQAANQSRVLRDFGLRQTAFGPDNAPLRTALRLDKEYTDEVRSQLYAGGVNVLTDDGGTIATWGYASGSLDPIEQDLHHQVVRMWMRWWGGGIIRSALGRSINADLKADVKASLDLWLEELRADGVFNDELDRGYVSDVDTLNTPQLAAARQFLALVKFRHAGTDDWSELVLTPNAPDAATL